MYNLNSKTQRKISAKPVNLKISLLLALAVVTSISAFAFGKKDVLNWKLDASVNNVDFYHAISVCNGKQVVFLKFVNKNTRAATVTFKEALKTSADKEEISFEGKKKFIVQPGETLAQNCSENDCKECILLPERAIPTHKVNVQDFAYKELKVTL